MTPRERELERLAREDHRTGCRDEPAFEERHPGVRHPGVQPRSQGLRRATGGEAMTGWEEALEAAERVRSRAIQNDQPGTISDIQTVIAALRAALSGSTAPLDVERLAEAMRRARQAVAWTPEAIDIATEYDALAAAASSDPAQGGDTRG